MRQWGLTIVSSAVVCNSANIRRTEFYSAFFLNFIINNVNRLQFRADSSTLPHRTQSFARCTLPILNMLTFPRQITSEFYKYTSSLSMDRFINAVDDLSNQKNSIVSLVGKFNNDNEFEMTSKWKVGPFTYCSSLYRPTIIKGYIFKNDNAQTQVNILVSPHSFVQLLFFVLPIFYAVIFFTIESSQKDLEFYILICTSFILTPIILLLFGMFLKNRLKNRFIKYFNLSQII